MNLVKIISTEVNALAERVVKFLRFGLNDVQTAVQAAPYGVDSNPIKDMIAIYGATSDKGKPVIIGYINKNQLADVGEHRIFSTDENGVLKTYIWLQADGIMEVGGSVDFMVRFSELKAGFDELKDDLNDMKSKWNTFAAAYVPGGPTPVGTPPTASTSSVSTASINDSKIDEIKTL